MDLVVHPQSVDRGVAALWSGDRLRLSNVPNRSDQSGPGSRGHADKGPSAHLHGVVLSYLRRNSAPRNTRTGSSIVRRESSVAVACLGSLHEQSEEIVGRRETTSHQTGARTAPLLGQVLAEDDLAVVQF